MADPRNYFAEMIATAQAVMGALSGDDTYVAPTVTIDATAGISAYIEKLTLDEILVAGGKAEKGGFIAVVALTDCPGGIEPAKFTTITTTDGQTGQVLFTVTRFGIVTITVGSPLSTDRRSSLMQ